MLSGDGNDITIVAEAAGGVIDASGVTFDTGNESVLFALSAEDDIVTGTSLDDTLVGLAGDDELIGGDGNDTLTGGDGNDTLTGGDGNDIISGGNDVDDINGGDGDDTITGGDGDDIIDTGAGGGDVTGGNDADTITLGAGDDAVIFTDVAESDNDSFDTIIGFTTGNDTLEITTGGTTLTSRVSIASRLILRRLPAWPTTPLPSERTSMSQLTPLDRVIPTYSLTQMRMAYSTIMLGTTT